MGSQTLATKYRPKTFEDGLVEQDYVKVILENQIKNNDVKNSYIFTRTCRNG